MQCAEWLKPQPKLQTKSGGNFGGKQKQLAGKKCLKQHSSEKMAELASMLTIHRRNYEKIGGGGRSRTVDAADMSRVL